MSLLISLALAPHFWFAGGDPSEIPEVEASGAIYKVQGKAVDPLIAMKKAGWSAVRLRLWNSPKDGYCDLAHTLALAKRIKAAGLTFMLDFHYSDYWADPAKQNKPAAWDKHKPEELKKAIHDYTRDVVKAFVDQGTPAEVVQPGNEVTNGYLWPDARLNINRDGWATFMELNKAAIQGIRDGAGTHQPKIMIHIDQGGRNTVSRYWFDTYFEMGGEADIIGLSYYPMWHGSLDQLQANLADLATRYKKDIVIAETAFPYRGWNDKTREFDENVSPVAGLKANPQGQAEYMRRLNAVIRATPNAHGCGVLWWAPAWLGKLGHQGGWSNLTLFDSESGEALPAFFALGSK